MTVEEYFEEWWTPKELPKNGFNKTAMLDFAEMYHNQALRIHDVSGSTSIYKYGTPTLLENTDKDPCDKCKYEIGENKKICSFCMKKLALNQYYR